MIDNKHQAMYGKTLGRLGCGGFLHFDAGQRNWEKPRTLKISIDDEEILELPVWGFDIHRSQDNIATTRVTFDAVEP